MVGRKRPVGVPSASLRSVVRHDERGIALQTAIIMAVLIAVAVSISAVILSRGGEVADDLQRQNVTFKPERLLTEDLCNKYDFKWDPAGDAGGTCKEKTGS